MKYSMAYFIYLYFFKSDVHMNFVIWKMCLPQNSLEYRPIHSFHSFILKTRQFQNAIVFNN